VGNFWWTKWHWNRFILEYFSFSCLFSFHGLLHTHVPYGAGTVIPAVVLEPNEFSVIQPHRFKKKSVGIEWKSVTCINEVHNRD
jgi:hypothetical protein